MKYLYLLFFLKGIQNEKIDLELTGKCNLKCVMCPQYFGIKNEEMSKEDFLKILPLVNSCDRVTLHGVGEPLYSPLLDFVLTNINENVEVFFNTNATLLKEDKIQLLLKHSNKIDYINVSLDSATNETYEKIRGGNLDIVLRNLRNFKKERDANFFKKPNIYLNMTIMKENMNELNKLLDLSLEFDSVVEAWPLNDDGLYGGEKWIAKRKEWTFIYEEQVVSTSDKLFLNTVQNAKNYAEKIGVKFLIWEDWLTKLEIKNCTLPTDHLNFYSNGDLKNCCYQTKPLANWKSIDLSDENIKSLSKKVLNVMKNNEIPKECSEARCPWVKGQKSKFDKNESNYILDR